MYTQGTWISDNSTTFWHQWSRDWQCRFAYAWIWSYGDILSSRVNWFHGALLGHWDKSWWANWRVRVQGGSGSDRSPDVGVLSQWWESVFLCKVRDEFVSLLCMYISDHAMRWLCGELKSVLSALRCRWWIEEPRWGTLVSTVMVLELWSWLTLAMQCANCWRTSDDEFMTELPNMTHAFDCSIEEKVPTVGVGIC